eukprot:1589592-Heterocapsa_arctica.AAC.1
MRWPVAPSVTPMGLPMGAMRLQSCVTLVPQALMAQDTNHGVSAASPGLMRTATTRTRTASMFFLRSSA